MGSIKIKVEKKVKMPEPCRRGLWRKTLDSMSNGDSFAIVHKYSQQIRSAANKAGYKITIRKEDCLSDKSRIWLIKRNK